MKEIPLPNETQDLTELEIKLFKILRAYFNDSKETESITNEEIIDRIKKAYRNELQSKRSNL